MQINDVARIAVAAFGPSKAPTMVAIAGAESGFDPAARGDRLDSFPPARQEVYARYAFDGYLSFGLWQVFLGVHTPLIQSLSGLEAPADLAQWLMIPANNATAAERILRQQGFEAWSTYNNATYLDFEIEASAAVSGVISTGFQVTLPHIVAVSFQGNRVHFDRRDGSFEERFIEKANVYGEWVRLELRE